MSGCFLFFCNLYFPQLLYCNTFKTQVSLSLKYFIKSRFSGLQVQSYYIYYIVSILRSELHV